jgi:hypothetical protein
VLDFGEEGYKQIMIFKKIQMPIENIPEIYIKEKKESPDLFVYDFRMTSDVAKSKVNLGMNMFSFLQVGKK